MQPGRLVKVVHEQDDFGWGAVINFQKKSTQKVTEHMLTYSVHVNVQCTC